MKKRLILFLATLFLLMAISSNANQAYAKTAASSAAFTAPVEIQRLANDKRAVLLQSYLEAHDSPLAPYATTFVAEADKNNLDWRLVASIAGLESTFGKAIPANSYNGWGFGIYGSNVRRFASWDEGITVVSQALREDYMNKRGAATIAEIGSIYAASPTWAVRVQGFMDSIDQYAATKPNSLGLSL